MDRVTSRLMVATPEQWQQGEQWYWRAHDYAASVAATYEMTLHQVAAIIAALSPGCKWDKNKKDAETVCHAAYNRMDMPTGINTYGMQLRKAWAIAHTTGDAYVYERMLSADRNIKTRSFYWNILSPWVSGDVTVDIWMVRMMDYPDAPSTKQYRDIADAVREVAGVFGLRPHEAQAILWLTERERKG